jgi:hypothetical protein
MSRRNGDRARFQKNRRRKLRHRQNIQKLLKAIAAGPVTGLVPGAPIATP